ncbi:MAG: AAA family ATPase [Chloroflexi bacterium]|nr:AAA family ATPase [Chloroflexota bacterium]
MQSQDNLYSPEEEKLVIGCLLVDASKISDVRILLAPEDFGTVDNQLIYRGILEVYDQLGACDAVLVADHLKKSGGLRRAGGSPHLYELQTVIVETENTIYYAKIVAEMSMRRQVVANCSLLSTGARNLETPINSVISSMIDNADSMLGDSKEGLSQITMQDLATKEFEELTHYVPDVIVDGLTILAGPSKIGKSFFCWNLAFAIAMQGKALNAIDIEKKSNVIFMAFDDSLRSLKRRAHLILDGGLPPDNIHVIDDTNRLKLDTAGIRILEKLIDEKEADVVFIDTWIHARPDVLDNRGKTSYDTDYEALVPIRQLAQRKKVAIVLVTHTRKQIDPENPFNQIQGSTGMQAGCDNLLLFSKKEDQVMLHISGREIIQAEYPMALLNGGIWSIQENEESDMEFDKPFTDQEDEVLKMFDKPDTQLRTSEIDKEFSGSNARVILDRLVTKGVLFKIKRGLYGCSESYQNFLNIADSGVSL